MDLNKALKYVLKDIPEEVKEVFREYVKTYEGYESIDSWCIVDTPEGTVDVNLVGEDYALGLAEGEISLAVYPTWECAEGYIHTDWTNWASECILVELLK